MWAGIAVLTLMALFPPWLVNTAGEWKYAGHCFIGTGPTEAHQQTTTSNGVMIKQETFHRPYACRRIDGVRFAVEVLPVIVITAGLLVTLRKDTNVAAR